MMEQLLALALLWDVGMVNDFKFNEYVDSLFVKNPENELLLELEWTFSNKRESIAIIRDYCYEYSMDYNSYGRFLFSTMKDRYFEHSMDIKLFGAKAYQMWEQIPNTIAEIEPFFTLNYAEDPLSWGDEKQTRELYETAFRFYDNK